MKRTCDSEESQTEHVTEQRTETVIDQGNTVQKTTALETTASYARQVLIARIIQYVFGVLVVLLAFRFVLGVLEANPLKGFPSFISGVTGLFLGTVLWTIWVHRTQRSCSPRNVYLGRNGSLCVSRAGSRQDRHDQPSIRTHSLQSWTT